MKKEKNNIEECNENGYILLGQAIIVQAVRDYKKNLAIIRKHPFDEEAGKEITRIEKFFHSGLYGAITTIDPDKLEGGVNKMDIKEYLSQAYRIDQRINSKMEQVSSLHALATKATATVSDMPGGGAKNIHKMENIIIKIADLENEINEDIDELVDLKIAITKLIKSVDNQEHQTLLELRYLCFKTWEQIAVDMGYKVRHLYRLHEEALKSTLLKEGVCGI